MMEASLSEIFSSIQGEGADLGKEALFIRLGGCNLSCTYCDTEYARQKAATFNVYSDGSKEEFENPARADDILGIVARGFRLPGIVVITGGEPLLQAEAVGDIGRRLRMKGCRVHLETNGTLPDGFAVVRQMVDSVSVDIKIDSLLEAGSFGSEHKRFLQMMGGIDGFAKIVVTESVTDAEVDAAAVLVAEVNPSLPVFLQPAFIGGQLAITATKLLRLRARAARSLRDVRISVQLHKIIDVR
jgi:7-carboxy-7-deazaguanine synthase